MEAGTTHQKIGRLPKLPSEVLKYEYIEVELEASQISAGFSSERCNTKSVP